jgi:thioesterase domain-containing protein
MSLQAIEPFVTLGLRETEAGVDKVVISVPLMGNRNDKGTLFGGSMYSAMLLAGWHLCGRQAEQAGQSGEIYVKDSAVQFLRPIRSDMEAIAELSEPPRMTRRGNLAYEVKIEAVDADGQLCGRATASYRLLPKSA